VSSRQPAETLPPVAIDRWARRTMVFEQMLSRAFNGNTPPELSKMLDEVKRLVKQVAELRSESVKEQRKLEGVEMRGRDGRQRFGFAVDALGIDASRARDEARLARADIVPETQRVTEAKAALMEAHREMLTWEGRSAFQEPYEGLREAYITAAAEVATWMKARRGEKAAQERAETRDREVLDLEFQIQELRGALAKLEQTVDAEQAESQGRIAGFDKKTEAFQVELLSIATRFCAPLRRRPELSSLFQELEADAAAA